MRNIVLSALLLTSAASAAIAGAEQAPPAASEQEPAAEPVEQDEGAKPNRKRPPSARKQPAPPDSAPNAEQSDDAGAAAARREKRDEEKAARERARAEAQAKREAEQAKRDAEAQAQREADKAKQDAEAAAQRQADEAKRDAEAQAKRDAENAQRDAEAQKQRDEENAARERARAEAQAKRDAEKAKQDAEAQAQREADQAKKDAETQAQRDDAKAARERTRTEAQAKRDAEQDKQDAEAKAQREANQAKKDAAAQDKQDAGKPNEASDVPAKSDADRAARRAKRQEQRGTGAGQQEPPPASEPVPAQQAAPDQRRAAPQSPEPPLDAPAANKRNPPADGTPAPETGPRRPATLPNTQQQPSANSGDVGERPQPGPKRKVIPAEASQAKEIIREERLNADAEFLKAKKDAEAAPARGTRSDNPRLDAKAATRFENVRKQRRERVEQGGVAIIEEPGQRTILRQRDRIVVRHDDGRRLQRTAREARRERRADGTTLIVNIGGGGLEIYTVEDQYGRILQRSRRDSQGRDVMLIDNRDYYRRHRDRGFIGATVNLGPLRLTIPRKRYIVEYDDVSEDELYETLWAPPVERLNRGYSLEEVRYSHGLRERMRRVDLDAITFAFASWEVDESQYRSLERMARVMKRILNRHPDEVFLIEGHTDAVGSEIDNLSLSDRRAESVAIILADEFQVPGENLTTQGYGEQYLKEANYGPSRINRRVAVRRITPLLSSGWGRERRR